MQIWGVVRSSEEALLFMPWNIPVGKLSASAQVAAELADAANPRTACEARWLRPQCAQNAPLLQVTSAPLRCPQWDHAKVKRMQNAPMAGRWGALQQSAAP